MMRPCREKERGAILEIVNDAATAYRGFVPADCLREPYMSGAELEEGIAAGIRFWGWEEGGELLGVMGLQAVRDVALIRHAYVRTARRREGIGSQLLIGLLGMTERPVLVGTWAAARWAVGFYEKHGFRLVPPAEKDRLLRLYWGVPERQIECSVVLADARWPGHASRPEGRGEAGR